MNFLYTHLPQSDLDCYPAELFQQFADHAQMLRTDVPWCAELEQEVFDHYVLFPRVNDEDLSFHRRLFFDALWPRVSELSAMEQRILEVNRWCHEMATYQMQDDRTASPLTVFRSGSGRCGEESAFLVSALRSVGIPARQVYAPRWAHCDDNHAWVEALCDGKWRFLGACEPEPILDRGWFNTPASRAVLVHSRVFGEGTSPIHGEFLCREGGVSWYNQTARYAHVREYTLRAVYGPESAPAPGAVFQVQLLNEAGFHTIAALTADENGEARVSLGLGDFHILATLAGLRAEGDCTGGSITLHLEPAKAPDVQWVGFDVRAPESAPVNPAELSDAQKAQRKMDLRRGNALRQARLAGLPEKARGNAAAIAAFLELDNDPRRQALVDTLSDKDMRDVTAQILEYHLQNTPSRGELPEEVYLSCVLCPRIELEPLTPWRKTLRDALSVREQEAFRADPARLWAFLNERVEAYEGRSYSNLVWTPAESWKAGRCDGRSRKLLYAAMLRAIGVPARLRPLDGEPEFWRDGAFHPIRQEQTGTLRLSWDANTAPAYRHNWSLSRRTPQGWQLLNLSNGQSEFSLPAGIYRLITSVRLPNGNQRAARRELEILPGEAVQSHLYMQSYALADMLSSQALPKMAAVTPDGQQICALCHPGRPGLLLWLEEGAEPTEHVLAELAEHRKELESLPVDITFLLRSRESQHHPSLSKLLHSRKGIRIALDDWHYDLEMAARALTCDPDTPPLAVVCDKQGRAVYGFSGYRVGLVELLTRIAAYLCG